MLWSNELTSVIFWHFCSQQRALGGGVVSQFCCAIRATVFCDPVQSKQCEDRPRLRRGRWIVICIWNITVSEPSLMTQFTDLGCGKQWNRSKMKKKDNWIGLLFLSCLLPLLHLSGWFSQSVLYITLLLSVFASPQPGALSILLWQWNRHDEPCLQGAFPQGQDGANKYTSVTPFTHSHTSNKPHNSCLSSAFTTFFPEWLIIRSIHIF